MYELQMLNNAQSPHNPQNYMANQGHNPVGMYFLNIILYFLLNY